MQNAAFLPIGWKVPPNEDILCNTHCVYYALCADRLGTMIVLLSSVGSKWVQILSAILTVVWCILTEIPDRDTAHCAPHHINHQLTRVFASCFTVCRTYTQILKDRRVRQVGPGPGSEKPGTMSAHYDRLICPPHSGITSIWTHHPMIY